MLFTSVEPPLDQIVADDKLLRLLLQATITNRAVSAEAGPSHLYAADFHKVSNHAVNLAFRGQTASVGQSQRRRVLQASASQQG